VMCVLHPISCTGLLPQVSQGVPPSFLLGARQAVLDLMEGKISFSNLLTFSINTSVEGFLSIAIERTALLESSEG